jgi:hypothetical protein
MDRRCDARLKEMLAQAEVPTESVDGFLIRLEAFVVPFAASLVSDEQRCHALEYLTGLLSKLEHKTAEGIAYLHDRERQGLQKFIGLSPWDHSPLSLRLARQVAAELAEADGVIVFDTSGFVKQGTKSVGVSRQWCGRAGKTENCRVGISMAYVSRTEHAIVDTRLYHRGLGFRRPSLHRIARVSRGDAVHDFGRPPLYRHAAVPPGFRRRVSR